MFSRITVQLPTSGQCRSQLPRLHEKGEVPRYDLSTYTHGFEPSVREVRPIRRDGGAMKLIGVAGEVSQGLYARVHIHSQGVCVRLAVVESLQALWKK